ncbi:MAG TPA: DUF1501 domain-containing protein [Planctomycetes bacterium]|jgi:hypothetical protein|nr:DUF1501 domain-containing protein [Planctomycetota bacterium]
MFNLMAGPLAENAALRRRDLMKLAGLGTLASWGNSDLWAKDAEEKAAARIRGRGTAKRCIYIFLCGGPSQLEMWDPKPDAPSDIRGPFESIRTNVPGIRIGELLPLVAEQADKFAIIRSMFNKTTVHDLGILYTLLASKSVQKKAYPAEPSDHPSLGAMLAKLLGPSGTLPPWVVVPRHFTTGARFYKGQSAGFLGPAFEPFALQEPKKDSLQRCDFNLEKLNFSEGFVREQFDRRRELLTDLERSDVRSALPEFQRHKEFNEAAISMLGNSGAWRAFDVTKEPQKLRERYGLNEYGQSFLLARRLVEADVRLVNVFWTFYGKDGCQFNLWDNHGSDKDVCGGANRGVDMLTHDYCCPSFDRAFSALLQDLNDRSLLDDTLVVVVGEFGRTPKINKNAGRDHWGSCYSAVLAGGGVRGGQVYGESDGQTASVVDSPVTPYDLHATVLHAFGVEPSQTIDDRAGRPIPVTDGQPVKALF